MSVACVGGEGIQKSHPEDRDLQPVTVCAGHKVPGSEGLMLPLNPCSEAVHLTYGLQTPGTDKVGGPALAQEARSNLPQLTCVDPSETQPVLAVSLQQFKGQPTSTHASVTPKTHFSYSISRILTIVKLQ